MVVATLVGDLNKSQWQTDYDSEWRWASVPAPHIRALLVGSFLSLTRIYLSRTQWSVFTYYCQSFFSLFFSFSRFFFFFRCSTIVSSKKGLCRWKSNEVHATHIRAKVEESEQQNEGAQVANHQRGKRYEIDSVVATTFQTTLLVRYSCRYAVRTILKTGVSASRVELMREVTSTAPS